MQSIPRDVILGDTIGEAYNKGISHVGILYVGDDGDPPQWWWDSAENVCLFGDPDLRMFVPGTDYSDANYWEQKDTKPLRYDEDFSINGHMPYGATSYPHEKEPKSVISLWSVSIIVIALVVIIVAVVTAHKKGKKE
jgi:hypothetical protein